MGTNTVADDIKEVFEELELCIRNINDHNRTLDRLFQQLQDHIEKMSKSVAVVDECVKFITVSGLIKDAKEWKDLLEYGNINTLNPHSTVRKVRLLMHRLNKMAQKIVNYDYLSPSSTSQPRTPMDQRSYLDALNNFFWMAEDFIKKEKFSRWQKTQISSLEDFRCIMNELTIVIQFMEAFETLISDCINAIVRLHEIVVNFLEIIKTGMRPLKEDLPVGSFHSAEEDKEGKGCRDSPSMLVCRELFPVLDETAENYQNLLNIVLEKRKCVSIVMNGANEVITRLEKMPMHYLEDPLEVVNSFMLAPCENVRQMAEIGESYCSYLSEDLKSKIKDFKEHIGSFKSVVITIKHLCNSFNESARTFENSVIELNDFLWLFSLHIESQLTVDEAVVGNRRKVGSARARNFQYSRASSASSDSLQTPDQPTPTPEPLRERSSSPEDLDKKDTEAQTFSCDTRSLLDVTNSLALGLAYMSISFSTVLREATSFVVNLRRVITDIRYLGRFWSFSLPSFFWRKK